MRTDPGKGVEVCLPRLLRRFGDDVFDVLYRQRP